MTEKQLRITGQDLARRRGVDQLVISNNGACLICGHPTGDCVSDDAATEVWSLAPPERDPLVHVHNDVWVDRPSPGAPSRPMTTLMIAGGTKRRLSEVLTVAAHGYDVQYTEVTDHPKPVEDKDLPGTLLQQLKPEEPAVVVEDYDETAQPVTEAEVKAEEPLADPAVEEAVAAGAAEPQVDDSAEVPDEDLPAALRKPEPAKRAAASRRKSA